jgi:hypothetical protein
VPLNGLIVNARRRSFRNLHTGFLERLADWPSTAAADPGMSALRSRGLLDVLSSRLAVSFVARLASTPSALLCCKTREQTGLVHLSFGTLIAKTIAAG